LFPTTALARVSQTAVPVYDALHTLTENLITRCEAWRSRGFDAQFAEEYMSCMWRLDETVHISNDKQKKKSISGINRGLAPSGALRLDVEGTIREFVAGDVF
jgi:hypothetical protein